MAAIHMMRIMTIILIESNIRAMHAMSSSPSVRDAPFLRTLTSRDGGMSG